MNVNCDNLRPPLNIWKYFSNVKNENYVIPYITTLTAIYLLLEDRIQLNEVEKYIYWYLDRVNIGDCNGISGTVYDLEITLDGNEKPLNIYDSADGYAGTFLTLTNLYCMKKKDFSIFRNNISKYLHMAYLIVHLRGQNGLTISDPQHPENYLMNNLEAYGGLLSACYALGKISHPDFSYYRKHAVSFNESIWCNFYDLSTGYFYWVIEDEKKYPIDPNKVYPDVYSQIFPVAYGLVYNRPKIRQKLIELIQYHLNPLKLPKEQYFMYRSMFPLERVFAYISQKVLPEL
ncbi:hypothetical protein [Persephonella sp.]|uniref:hypothetical protein n=1 Tax=Persephonella sp. TaxID=2060922 RepID=UPI00261F594B|nr:hypothetical protein [Persephonella sp.]